MKRSSKLVTLATALTAGLGTAFVVAPSYAQDANDVGAVAFHPRAAQDHARQGGPGGPGGRGGPGDLIANVRHLMATYNTDGDGIVTQEELNAVRAEELATYDANGDGVLSLEEFQALWLAHLFEQMVDQFQALDADGDGLITEEEFNAALANILRRLNQAGDGGRGAGDRPAQQAPQRPGTPAPRLDRAVPVVPVVQIVASN